METNPPPIQPIPNANNPQPKPKQKLPAVAHLMCGWPLFLVLIGGAIGGGLAGAAYAVNIAIYKSGLPVPAKIILNIMTGGAAIVLWALIVGVIHSRWK